MDEDLCRYARLPLMFFARYVLLRPIAHLTILVTVLLAVGCSVGTQYGLKFLVDTLSDGPFAGSGTWIAFGVLASLITADHLLWRLAGWVASYAFVAVTGDLRRDLFRHLAGHSPRYFAERLPGTLTSRITATSNAVFTVENMLAWNVLPPCVAIIGATALVFTVSIPMAAGLATIASGLLLIMFRLAAAGRPLHHAFANRAAAVDGQMMDVIGNMPLVRAFGGFRQEYARFNGVVDREMTSRRRSLLYLEKIRLFHAVVTVVMAIGLIGWAVILWQQGAATTGQVVLVCTLGVSILHGTRDLAVALVDVTQHVARLAEALDTLLVPHDLRDDPKATPLVRHGARVTFENVSFCYPDGRRVFKGFNLSAEPGQRIGLIGPSGSGKSTLFTLLQRFYDPQGGRILIDGQDIARITQESLRQAISVVPQDVSLFHRSVITNIRYGRPDATDAEVFAAAAAARCLDFIEALPNGFGTIVGDRGVKLSGGQRQRIAIARALLKDAPILLLDEATSALDTESEEAIRKALDRLMLGRTVLVIAHRLSTVRGFDRIVVLQDGELVQDGPPDMLLRHEGLYRDLMHREVRRLSPHVA